MYTSPGPSQSNPGLPITYSVGMGEGVTSAVLVRIDLGVAVEIALGSPKGGRVGVVVGSPAEGEVPGVEVEEGAWVAVAVGKNSVVEDSFVIPL